MITLNFRDSRPIYEQVKLSFIRLITTGVMEADEKLPSVRELSAQLAINPNTIQKAYGQMESEGYIYTISGRGSFVSHDAVIGDKRKGELMSDLERIVDDLIEMSIEKDEILKLIEERYRGKEREAKKDD